MIYENICKLAKERGISINKLEEKANVSTGSIQESHQWVSAGADISLCGPYRTGKESNPKDSGMV